MSEAEHLSAAVRALFVLDFWQELTLLQLRGQPVDRRALGAENGWPPAGDPADEADWQALAGFYEAVFGCVHVPPERDLAGPAIEAGTGLPKTHLRGIHLRLPG